MKNQAPPPDDGRLRALLRESCPAPDLPPGFQQAVWRRIERAPRPRQSVSLAEGLDAVVGWLLQPRLALAGATVLLLVGIAWGARQGSRLAHDTAKQQYLAAVSPLTAR